MMKTTSRREYAILWMLAEIGRWLSMSELMPMVKDCRSFRRPDGWPLKNLRDAVHTTLDALKRQGMVETAQRAGARGQVRWVGLSDVVAWDDQNGKRRSAGEVVEYLSVLDADTFSDGRSVGGQKQAKLMPLQ